MSEPVPTCWAFPIVNINGSSRESLIDSRMNAIAAVRDAMKQLQQCAPHGRDYQTVPGKAYEIARARYQAQFAALDKLVNELNDELDFIISQTKPC